MKYIITASKNQIGYPNTRVEELRTVPGQIWDRIRVILSKFWSSASGKACWVF
jgi:hypothetical protein